MSRNSDFGKEAEQMAADFLVDNSHKIMERNFRYLNAEVDIISLRDGILHIVEVKARSYTHYGEPQDFVNTQKIKLLIKVANYYVEKNDLNVEVQFDIISIVKHQGSVAINYIEDAFSFY